MSTQGSTRRNSSRDPGHSPVRCPLAIVCRGLSIDCQCPQARARASRWPSRSRPPWLLAWGLPVAWRCQRRWARGPAPFGGLRRFRFKFPVHTSLRWLPANASRPRAVPRPGAPPKHHNGVSTATGKTRRQLHVRSRPVYTRTSNAARRSLAGLRRGPVKSEPSNTRKVALELRRLVTISRAVSVPPGN